MQCSSEAFSLNVYTYMCTRTYACTLYMCIVWVFIYSMAPCTCTSILPKINLLSLHTNMYIHTSKYVYMYYTYNMCACAMRVHSIRCTFFLRSEVFSYRSCVLAAHLRNFCRCMVALACYVCTCTYVRTVCMFTYIVCTCTCILYMHTYVHYML